MKQALAPGRLRWHAMPPTLRQKLRALEHLRRQHDESFLPVLGVERICHRGCEAREEPWRSQGVRSIGAFSDQGPGGNGRGRVLVLTGVKSRPQKLVMN
jgi:hypothetical protein